MHNPEDRFAHDAPSRRREPPEITVEECYHGVELAPRTLESLVTWDVSVHAQRERERLNAASHGPGTHGGY